MGYSCAIWHTFWKEAIDEINQIHISAAIFVTSNYSRKAIVSTVFKSLACEDLQTRRRNTRLTLFYKILNCHANLPVRDKLVPADVCTRGANNKKYKNIWSATSVTTASYYLRAIPDWNRLPEETVIAHSVDAFKARLINCLMTAPSSITR